MSKKNTTSARQKRFIENKKDSGFKKIQVYISSDSYEKLLMMKNNNINNKSTFSTVIEDSLSCQFRVWSKYVVERK